MDLDELINDLQRLRQAWGNVPVKLEGPIRGVRNSEPDDAQGARLKAEGTIRYILIERL